MKKKIAVTISILCIAVALFWAKGYYNERYVAVDSYYTQIPFDEVNEDSWLFDKDGIKQEKGKEYNLVGYNKKGEKRDLVFTQRGSAKDYYAPGTYIKANVSKTLVVGIEIVNEKDIPEEAMNQMLSLEAQ